MQYNNTKTNYGQKTPSPEKRGPLSPVRKSAQKAKEMPQRDFYEKRIIKIKEFLSFQRLSLTQNLTDAEILRFLDSLGKDQFNREIAAQLFERLTPKPSIRSGSEKVYNLGDFCDAHIKAEYLLLLQAEDTEIELDRIYSQIDALKFEYQELLTTPQVAGESNSVELEIIEVVSNDSKFKTSPYTVIVVFDNYKYETEEVSNKSAENKITFNHTFHIRVGGNDRNLKIKLRDYKDYEEDENYKELACDGNLNKLQESKMNDLWLNFFDAKNKETNTKIHVKLSYAFSKTAIFEETINKLKAIEAKLLENRNNIEFSLKQLVNPFANPVF